jgi:hypothetical protein
MKIVERLVINSEKRRLGVSQSGAIFQDRASNPINYSPIPHPTNLRCGGSTPTILLTFERQLLQRREPPSGFATAVASTEGNLRTALLTLLMPGNPSTASGSPQRTGSF